MINLVLWLKRNGALVALLCTIAADASTQTHGELDTVQVLDTPSYSLRILVRCREGEVTCDRVGLIGQNKQTHKEFELQGVTVHSRCADNASPCRFLGYQFQNEGLSYFVSEDGELEIRGGDKTLLVEQGKLDLQEK